jgi:hypothetical protein
LLKHCQTRYGFLIVIFLVALIVVASADEATQTNFGSFQHMDTGVLNDYISTMIKNKEPEMKAAIVNGTEITDFKLKDAAFDIMTGKLVIEFMVDYKNSDITGALDFEVRVSDAASPKIGGYCLGLDGGLHSSKILTDIMLALAKSQINKSLVGKEFWSDNQTYNQYKIFKNENLTYMVNKVLIESDAADNQFKKINQPVPGGVLQVEFKNITCNSFDLSVGQAQISSNISAVMQSDFGNILNFPDAGILEANFDFYINPVDKSWWAKLNKFKLNIHLLAPEFNVKIQEMIDKELNERRILIPLDMPKSK